MSVYYVNTDLKTNRYFLVLKVKANLKANSYYLIWFAWALVNLFFSN